jgi:hypothetical protein
MERMQKLEERDTYTPTGAPQARSSVAGWLNSSVRVGSVLSSLKTSSNNSDVDLLVSEVPEQTLRLSVAKTSTPNSSSTKSKIWKESSWAKLDKEHMCFHGIERGCSKFIDVIIKEDQRLWWKSGLKKIILGKTHQRINTKKR